VGEGGLGGGELGLERLDFELKGRGLGLRVGPVLCELGRQARQAVGKGEVVLVGEFEVELESFDLELNACGAG
jgi:hypothetical protein